MTKLYILLCGATAALLMAACQGGKTAAADAEAGDTLEMKYAKLLTIVKHGDGEETSDEAEGVDYQYTEAIIANPWKAGTMLHRYILIPKGEEGDKTVAMLARRHSTGARCTTDTVRTPVERSAVFIAPHCQLMYELGCQQAIRGVCDLDYINIPDVKKRAASAGNAAAGKTSAGNSIVDCGLRQLDEPRYRAHHRPETRSHPTFAFRKQRRIWQARQAARAHHRGCRLYGVFATGQGGMDEILRHAL